MLSTFWLQAADDALGRIDRSTLTDQQKMELLVADLTPAAKAYFQDSEGMFREVRQWKGVKTNASNEPYLVRWEKKFLGTIALDFMPAKMTHFIVWACSSLEGTLDTEKLPVCLKELILFQTALSGTVALENLPKSVFTYLNISKGNFSGTLNLEDLPPKSKGILLHTNAFAGSSSCQSFQNTCTILTSRTIG